MKVVLWIVAVVGVLLLAAVVYVAVFSGSLLKDAIEGYGPGYLGTEVEVRAVDLSLTEGSGEIRDLRIGNPSGFDGPHAMRLGKLRLVLDTNQISDQLVVLKQIEIDGAEIAAVARGKKTNLQQIMDNLAAATGGGSTEEAQSDLKLIIDRLDFTNIRTSLSSDLLGDVALEIPDIRLTDVGRKSNGATVGEVLQQVLGPVYRAVSREMVAKGIDLDPDQLKDRLKDNLRERFSDQLGDGFQGLRDSLGHPN